MKKAFVGLFVGLLVVSFLLWVSHLLWLITSGRVAQKKGDSPAQIATTSRYVLVVVVVVDTPTTGGGRASSLLKIENFVSSAKCEAAGAKVRNDLSRSEPQTGVKINTTCLEQGL